MKFFNAQVQKVDAIVLQEVEAQRRICGLNSRIIADAVYDSEIPIMSAVGHEIDLSICDLCADM